MRWSCRLFGHQWHHSGPFEVIVRDQIPQGTPFTCDTCAETTVIRREASPVGRHRD